MNNVLTLLLLATSGGGDPGFEACSLCVISLVLLRVLSVSHRCHVLVGESIEYAEFRSVLTLRLFEDHSDEVFML